MNELVEKSNQTLEASDIRDGILEFEQALKQVDGATIGDSVEAPLKHMFAPGIYVRQITLPKGMCCVGKIHRHEHPNFLMSGEVDVITEEGGIERIKAPRAMISPAGTKRAVYAIEDTVWITVHATNSTDLEEIEKEVIVESYEQLNKEKPCLG